MPKASFELPPSPIDKEDIKETLTADIVVIGAGTAGLVTAVRAAEAGAKVIVIAKDGTVSARGGSNFAIGSKLAKKLGKEFDWQIAYEKLLAMHSHRVNEQLWSTFAQKSGAAMDWMCDKAEAAGLTPVLQTYYEDPVIGEYPGTHMFLGGPHGRRTSGDPQFDILLCLVAEGKNLGIEFYFKTRAEQLVRESSGRVTGVIAKGSDGSYVKFAGRKAVVLATGDYAADQEMKAKYCPLVKDLPSHVTPRGTNSGDGHKMALWIGAAMQKNELHAPMLFGVTNVKKAVQAIRKNADNPEVLKGIDTLLARGGGIWNLNVNTAGERYCSEHMVMAYHAMQMLMQPGQKAYGIWDAKYADYAADQPNSEPFFGAPKPMPQNIQKAFDVMADEGFYFRADTIEELARKLKLPADKLKATVNRYNLLCKAGHDEDFGKPAEFMLPVEEPPFYAAKVFPGLLIVVGGLRTNAKMQVLDADDQVIPGLYAVGTVSGDFFANAYTTHFPGHNLGRCITFGYLIGHNIATEAASRK